MEYKCNWVYGIMQVMLLAFGIMLRLIFHRNQIHQAVVRGSEQSVATTYTTWLSGQALLELFKIVIHESYYLCLQYL